MQIWLRKILLLLFLSFCSLSSLQAQGTKQKATDRTEVSIDRWIALLSSEQSHLRETAAIALGKLGPKAKRAAPNLDKACKDKSYRVRCEAWIAYRLVKPFSPSIPALNGSSDWTRYHATSVLLLSDPAIDDYVLRLAGCLESKETEIRHKALKRLRYIGPKADKATPTLKKYLAEEKDAALRFQVAYALAEIEPQLETMLPLLRTCLKDKSEKIRGLGVRLVNYIGPEAVSAVPLLLPRLHEGNEELRAYVLETFKVLGVQAIPMLTGIRDRRCRSVRSRLARSLSFVSSQVLPALGKVVNDRLLIDGLRFLEREVLPHGVALLDDGERQESVDIAFVLGELGVQNEAVMSALRELRSSDDVTVKIAAITAIRKLAAR